MHNAKSPESNGSALTGKTILLVNTGSAKKRFIVQRLKKLGMNVVALNKEKNWAQPYVDHWILADNTNHNQAIEAVQRFIASNPAVKIDGVLTFWEDDVLLTAKIVDKFNFIGIPFNIARRIRNKYLFRDFCRENGLPVPRYHTAKSQADLDYACSHFQFPLIIKPAFGSSSAFVMKVKDKEELQKTYRFITSAISPDSESALTDGLDVFIEEYIDGDEVDIDLIIQNGKIKFHSVTDNYNKDKGSFFQDSGQAIPSGLPEKDRQELLDMSEEALEKVGIQNGCIHVEAKYTKKGPMPIEVNLRMGGDYVWSYTKDAWGVDLIECAAKIAVGDYLKFRPMETPKKYIIGWDLHPEDSGMLAELDIDEELEDKAYLEEMQMYKEVGDPVLVPPEGFEHLGWLTVSGENLLDARDNLNQALALIDFKVVRFDESSFMGKTERKDRFSSAVLNKNLIQRYAKIENLKKTSLKNIKSLSIGLLCNVNLGTGNPIESKLNETPFKIENTLKKSGYNVTVLNANDLPMVIDRLRHGKIDLVFNIGIGEKIYGGLKYKPHLASLLELLQIPYTGSGVFTMFLANDKIRFRKILDFHDIPTPAWDYVYTMDDELDDELQYPLIVKPAAAIHSLGISNHSVVPNRKALQSQLEYIVRDMGMPALVEEYIEGDEYEAYVLGNEEGNLQVLPLRRSMFDKFPPHNWHIITSDAKYLEPEMNSQIIRQLPPKNISRKLQSLISEIALDTYSIFDCLDYGKVKIKTDQDGNPYILELNPNPSLHHQWGLALAAKTADIDYPRLLEEIIYNAVQRYKKEPPMENKNIL